MASSNDQQESWFLKYSLPTNFEALVHENVHNTDDDHQDKVVADEKDKDNQDSFTIVSSSTSKEVRDALDMLELDSASESQAEGDAAAGTRKSNNNPFVLGLLSHGKQSSASAVSLQNKMLTENTDVAYRSTQQGLLDLFAELEDVISGPRLLELLNAAWNDNPLMTLKIIFNARSIHLGKASRATFYRCAGWLARNHPLSLISNLRWLSRPVIEKKAEKKDDGKDDEVLVDPEPEKDEDDCTRFDVKNGVAHGYWKDLLNILVLAVNGKLHVLANPRDILNVVRVGKGKKFVDKQEAKIKRHEVRDSRHDQAVATFNSSPVYQGLHLTIARLFAEQLKSDLLLLRDKDNKAKKNISLCAKWAPSHDRFHDRHTFIVSSIAEMLHPLTDFTGDTLDMDRELYLRHARERYRKDISALRAHLDIVERNLSAKTLEKIRYERVPSLAMSNYAKIFIEKDTERFQKYINGVAEGIVRISGATLLPSTLIRSVRRRFDHPRCNKAFLAKGPKTAIEAKMQELSAKVVDGRWKTLVQRIKDSGTLESSIAVCDVSASMNSPTFPDGTCPMDSAIGLSLLLAEVTAPPFGGNFITFSAEPEVQRIDLSLSLQDKISLLSDAAWDMNTNFVDVFEQLILPMAIRNNLRQEDMVKRVFVFSDMQFDRAGGVGYRFADSSGIWPVDELATAGTDGDPTAPKPVTAEEKGTAIVSGYSQGMLKVFLDNGSFDEPEDDEDQEPEVKTAEEDDAVLMATESPAKKRKMDPMGTLKKAVGHKAYDPLKVVD